MIDYALYDLHSHTTFSDGRCDLAEMVDLAEANGLAGMAVTDHASSEEDALKLLDSYATAKYRRNIPVLLGVESCVADISGKGSVSTQTLQRFQWRLIDLNWYVFKPLKEIADQHSRLEAVTEVLCRTCQENPAVQVMAHPFNFGPIDVPLQLFDNSRLERIAQAFVQHNKCFEVMNAMYYWHAQNMEFPQFHQEYCRILQVFKESGVRFTLGSDSHSSCGIGKLTWSCRVVRELGLEKQLYIPEALLNK